MTQFAQNLRRVMARFDLTIVDVVELSGLDERTVKSMLAGRTNPHARTLHRLASGVGIQVDEFFQPSSVLAHRSFDRATNPIVEQVIEQSPELFAGWTDADFDELYSRFGAGGAFTLDGARAAAENMNRNREVHQRVALLLETSEAEFLSRVVELLHQRVQLRPASVSH